MKQIELLYINKKNNQRLQEWYSLLNYPDDLSPQQQSRLDVLDEEFQCKALLFNDKPQSRLIERETIRNEIIMAFGYVVSFHVIDLKERRYLDRRFKYIREIAELPDF